MLVVIFLLFNKFNMKNHYIFVLHYFAQILDVFEILDCIGSIIINHVYVNNN